MAHPSLDNISALDLYQQDPTLVEALQTVNDLTRSIELVAETWPTASESTALPWDLYTYLTRSLDHRFDSLHEPLQGQVRSHSARQSDNAFVNSESNDSSRPDQTYYAQHARFDVPGCNACINQTSKETTLFRLS